MAVKQPGGMSVPWFWFAQQLNVLLFYHPYLLLLVLSGFLPPSLSGPTPVMPLDVTVLSLRSLSPPLQAL